MPHSNNLCYEFGPYLLNMVQRVLTRSGETISLTPKATDLLALLVENAGELVEKDVLLKEIWPDTFVEEGNVTQAIFQLRRALGDDRTNPKYIETVTRRGYRFIAPVQAISSKNAKLLAFRGTQNEGTPDKPTTLVVLPFTNEGEDITLKNLSTDLTERLTNNISRLQSFRVIAWSAALRHVSQEMDVTEIGRNLKVDAILTAKINTAPEGLRITAELIDVHNGWQLWGESYDCPTHDLINAQNEILRNLVTSVQMHFNGDQQPNRAGSRHTDNKESYKAYLQARRDWNSFTYEGVSKALTNFRRAIEKDHYYALAYAGAVDCYLRLTTNYLPPPKNSVIIDENAISREAQLRLRHEWDWRNAEREIRRATELNNEYPAGHQWYAAYEFARNLFLSSKEIDRFDSLTRSEVQAQLRLTVNTPFLDLTRSEEIQVFCAVARDQIDCGNYTAAYAVLKPFWQLGTWPNLEGIQATSRADLLFTCGEIAGFVASTNQHPEGQKHGEALLSGAVALFEQLGSKSRLAESRIELGLCYYRQGSFELGRRLLSSVIDRIEDEDAELRNLALIRLASLERHAGRPYDALTHLAIAHEMIQSAGPWTNGRCHLELGSTYRALAMCDRAITKNQALEYFDLARKHYRLSLQQFEAIGNHRLAATAKANLGHLALELDEVGTAELLLNEAYGNFVVFQDLIKCAQVQDTLARLYLKTARLIDAKITISKAVETMETGDEDVLLAEAMITKGLVLCRLGSFSEGKAILESAYALAHRIRDEEQATIALVTLIEELDQQLDPGDLERFLNKIRNSSFRSQKSSTTFRVRRCLDRLSSNETS